MTSKKKIQIKILCKRCGTETNHSLEWSKLSEWGNEDIQGNDEHQILSCNGCESITYRIISSNSEDMDWNENDQPEYTKTYTYYPNRDGDMIEPIYEVWKAPSRVREIYYETIVAYNNKQPILCSIGIRGIIEAVCLEENIQAKNLELKINALRDNKIITPNLCNGLHESRLMGNDGAHKLGTFSPKDLKTAIGLINNLIDGHYSLPSRIEELKKRALKIKK